MGTVLRRCFEFAVLGVVTWRVWIEAGPATATFAAWTIIMVVSLNRYRKTNDKAWTGLVDKLKWR